MSCPHLEGMEARKRRLSVALRRLADTIDEMEKAGEIGQDTYGELDDCLWQTLEAAGLEALPPSPRLPMAVGHDG